MDPDDPRRCTAKSKQTGERCRRPVTPGCTVCYYHGGAGAHVEQVTQRHLEEQAARRAVAVLGLDENEDINPDPHQALMDEVHRAARWVAGIELAIADLDADQLVHGVIRTVTLPDGGETVTAEAALNVYVLWYHQERDRLVRASKAALDAGVSERLVRLEEEKGRLIAELIGRVMDDPELGLSDEQRHIARVVAARHLRALPGGQTS